MNGLEGYAPCGCGRGLATACRVTDGVRPIREGARKGSLASCAPHGQ
jgi:hypothetical protein